MKVWENKTYNAKKGSCLHAASNEYTVRNKLGRFLAHSTFLPAQASLWPERSVATT